MNHDHTRYHTSAAARLAERLLDAAERGDAEAIDALIHDDCDTVMPMTMSGDPDDAQWDIGRSGTMHHVGLVFQTMSQVRFVDRRISVADDDVVFVETRGDFVTKTGVAYRNTYVFRFDVLDGKLTRWTEYYNPVTISVALGFPVGPTS